MARSRARLLLTFVRVAVLGVGGLGVAVLGGVACGGDSSSDPTTTEVTVPAPTQALTRVSPQQGQDLIQQLGSALTVIDVRTAEEFAAGHIDGAVNYDIEGGQFSALVEPLDRAAAYMVYCHSGRRSALAADAMVAAGFTQVYDLGGISDWVEAGLPIVTG